MKNEKWLASYDLNQFARLFPDDPSTAAVTNWSPLEKIHGGASTLCRPGSGVACYNNRFVYETDIDPLLTEGEYRVPSLLVQPYVENAIVHGLGLSTREDGYVRVAATLHGDYICYRITDNGVGRARAGEVRRVNNPNHRSVGLAITENRINIFSHQQNSAGRVSINRSVQRGWNGCRHPGRSNDQSSLVIMDPITTILVDDEQSSLEEPRNKDPAVLSGTEDHRRSRTPDGSHLPHPPP